MRLCIPFQAQTDWTSVPAAELTHCGWTPETSIRAQGQLSCDGRALHVRMTAAEQPIRATLSGKLDQVCTDSCLEFFFAPQVDDDRYFNFEWNRLGALSLSFGTLRATRIRLVPKDAIKQFAFRSFQTKDGWGVEYEISLDFLRVFFPDYTFTGDAGGNFYKCGDKTEFPHFLSWAPMSSDTPDFHRRGDFGTLHFEEGSS